MVVNETESIAQSTVILSFFQGVIGNTKKISKEEITAKGKADADDAGSLIETDVDPTRLRVSKYLLDAPELKAIQKHNALVRHWVRNKSVPSFLRGGMYMVRLQTSESIDVYLAEQQEALTPLVEAFCDALPLRIQESKEKLGPAFDMADFPTADQVRAALKWKWQWLSMDTPSSLKKISQGFFQREAKKAEEGLKSVLQNVELLLLGEAKQLLAHAIDRLTPDTDGKKKFFKNTITSNITEWLTNLPLRNVTGSGELDQVVVDLNKLMEGVSPDDLRKSDKLREDVTAGFKAMTEKLDGYIAKAPSRFMELG